MTEVCSSKRYPLTPLHWGEYDYEREEYEELCLSHWVFTASLAAPRTPPPLLTNTEGQTQLHVMCQNPQTPFQQVRGFLEVYPQAARMADLYGRTAIYYALKNVCGMEIVLLLLREAPESLTTNDLCRDCGLHLLYHKSQPPCVLQAVLHENPSLALVCSNTFSRRRLVDRICDPWSKLPLKATRDPTNMPPAYVDAWTKLVLTVQAAHRATIHGEETTGEEFHAALELGLAPSLLAQFARAFPSQVSRPMARQGGMLPLHYLVSSSCLHGGGIDSVAALIRFLVNACSQATQIKHRGRLPLHLALVSSKLSNHKDVLLDLAIHDALQCADGQTGLPPFLTAANVESSSSLETVFCLLRERPCVCRNYG